jgi:hypothetical protein
MSARGSVISISWSQSMFAAGAGLFLSLVAMLSYLPNPILEGMPPDIRSVLNILIFTAVVVLCSCGISIARTARKASRKEADYRAIVKHLAENKDKHPEIWIQEYYALDCSRLTAKEVAAMEQHLTECEQCRRSLQMLLENAFRYRSEMNEPID